MSVVNRNSQFVRFDRQMPRVKPATKRMLFLVFVIAFGANWLYAIDRRVFKMDLIPPEKPEWIEFIEFNGEEVSERALSLEMRGCGISAPIAEVKNAFGRTFPCTRKQGDACEVLEPGRSYFMHGKDGKEDVAVPGKYTFVIRRWDATSVLYVNDREGDDGDEKFVGFDVQTKK